MEHHKKSPLCEGSHRDELTRGTTLFRVHAHALLDHSLINCDYIL